MGQTHLARIDIRHLEVVMRRNPLAVLVLLAVAMFIIVTAVQLGLALNAEHCFETPPEGGLGGGYDCVR